MSCINCEEHPVRTFVRVGTGNVEIIGCSNHLLDLLNKCRTPKSESLEEKIETLLTWIMANRDVHSRVWMDTIEPELRRQIKVLIEIKK